MRRGLIVLALLLVPMSAMAAGRPRVVDPATDHIRGTINARVSLIEYADFQCPYCRSHHPVMKQLVTKYKGTVNWVFRHYPLSFHPLAPSAAHASECAAELGGNDAFWKLTDSLFEVSTFDYRVFSKANGIVPAKFMRCMRSKRHRARVQADADDGTAAGVTGTPTTFIWDHRTDTVYGLEGALPIDAFTTALDAIIAGEKPANVRP